MEKTPDSIESITDPPIELAQDQTAEAAVSYLDLVKGRDHIGASQDNTKTGAAVFKDVKVLGGDVRFLYQETVPNLLLPLDFIHGLFTRRVANRKLLLDGIEGIVREGEMLLVLGKPGSGCTTLLKTLAGLTDTYHGWSGSIEFFGVAIDAIKKRFRGDVVYNAEGDVHIPFLTVEETLGFAVNTKTPSADFSRRDRKSAAKSITTALIRVFGLERTTHTLVGNEYVHGVSGGEMKRVSLAEVLSTNAKVTLWDNSTQGLDATTSIRFGKALQAYSKSGKNIAIAALYQASDDIVYLFDKVTIIHEGHQIFFGTIAEAQEYFGCLGFRWGNRQSLSDFLVSATARNLCEMKEGWRDRVPRSVEDFVKNWKGSEYYRKLQLELGAGSNAGGDGEEDKKGAVVKSEVKPSSDQANSYLLPWSTQLAVTFQRSVWRLLGDKPFLFGSIVMPIVISIVFGTAFYDTPDNTIGFFSRQGVLFFGILFNTIQTLGEISTQYSQRPIVQKQASFAMYHPGLDALASLLALWPIKFVSVSLFNVSLYFLSNLKREPGAFFIFLLFTFTMVLLMSSMFRFVAAINKHESTAISIAGVLILPLVIYTGYVIPQPSMHPWFKWISYINPLSYAFESLMANEFHNREVPCAVMIPSGLFYASVTPQYQVCPVTGSIPGSNMVSGDSYIEASFDYHYSHLWRNYGILFAFFIFFLVIYALAVEYYPQVVKGRGDVLIFLRKGFNKIKRTPPISERASERNVGATAQIPGQVSEDQESFATLGRSRDCFTWNNVDYEIPFQRGTKTLLTGIHGYVKPGTMTAMLGESGAGKTTLINVLAQRVKMGLVSGDIMINCSKRGNDFARGTGYVESQDVHLSEFTVRETMRFSAQLRQPQSVSDAEKNEYVEEVIVMLDMGAYADAVVGVPGSGLSLEQRKKLTIGVELVAKPSLLFLDEPTSGLDSQSSWSIVQCCRKLANSGQAILCTIHQPSALLFEQFDRILLLQKGGRCVYFGDIGNGSQTIINYLETKGAPKCRPKTNPAEYILQVTETGTGSIDWAATWQSSTEAQLVNQEIEALNRPSTQNQSPSQNTDPTSVWHQFRIVLKRSLIFYWRSPVYIRAKIILNAAAGLFLGFTFYKEKNSAQGLQNKMFATFGSLITSVPLMNQLQPRFFESRALYEAREEPAKMYHWSIFVFVTAFTEMMSNFVTGTLFFIPWYCAVGLYRGMPDASSRGIYMWLIFMLFEMWASTWGQLLAALAPTIEVSTLLIPLTIIFVLLFCGVLQPISQLPHFWHFVHTLSPFTYLISSLFSTILHSTPVTCLPKEINLLNAPANLTCGQYLAPFLLYANGKVMNPDVMGGEGQCEYCRYKDGDQYLNGLGVEWADRWRNFGFMWVYVAFNLTAFVLRFWLRGKLGVLKRRFGRG